MFVGRVTETTATRRLIAGAREGRSGVLLIHGEAGIGKSALLDHLVELANSFTVLRCAGVEAESELAYAGLHQLLRPVFDRIDRLPGPQAAALRSAFGLSNETVDERLLVSLGVLGLLSEVAEERPLLCLVDDLQWIDQPSAEALLFAARRLEAEGIAVVLTARDDPTEPFTARGVPELQLNPLTQTDARLLIAEHHGANVSNSVIEWLVENAVGNPLALVELPLALSRRQLIGQDAIGGLLPLATSVDQVYLNRLARLSDDTQRLLVLAAAEDTGARSAVATAAQVLRLDVHDLAPAESLGLIRVDSEQVAFRHPLVRSAVYRRASFTEREQAHRALAAASEAEGSSDRAAWHRAAATVGVSEEVARELESTAERARLRSGHAAAASALERAADLSPDPEPKALRLIGAATAAWNAGQPGRAEGLLGRVSTAAPGLNAAANDLRGVIEWRCGSVPDACETLTRAAADIALLDPQRAAQVFSDAGLACWDAGAYEQLGRVGRAAAELLQTADDGTLLVETLAGAVLLIEGAEPDKVPGGLAAISRACESDDPRLLIWAAIGAEVAGEGAIESTALARLLSLARASNAVDRLTLALESTVVQGFLAGDFTVKTLALEGLELARAAGLPNPALLQLASLAWLSGVQGHEDECRFYAEQVTLAAHHNRHALANSITEWGLALLDLGGGRPEQAATRLVVLEKAPPGIAHPFYVLSSAPDLVEAAMRSGDEPTARSAFTLLDDFAGPVWARSLAARCRGLLADGEAAEYEFTTALELHGDHGNPFDRARTQLVYGEYLRRQRRPKDAREQLEAALRTLQRQGAKLWAERARNELRATGAKAPKRAADARDELTPQELQVARLVGEGLSNKEAAAQLYLSPRTVEYHLRKVFMKLGIGSRAELIRMASVDDA